MKRLLLFSLLMLQGQALLFGQQRPLIFATYTYSTNNRLQNLEPLAMYLSEKTGIAIQARSYPTVGALINAIVRDSVDFAMINTLGYLSLERRHPGHVTLMQTLDMENQASTNYGGCLIARKESGLHTMRDLQVASRKLSLALVNSSSTSGNLVPRLLFNAAGIRQADSSFSLQYLGTHQAVTEAVLAGKMDLGGCGCAEVDSARKYLQFDQVALVIDTFNDIPLGPVLHNRQVPRDIAQQVSYLLARLHEDNIDVFAQFRNGWTEFRMARRFKPVSDKDYDAFRKMFGDNAQLWKMIE